MTGARIALPRPWRAVSARPRGAPRARGGRRALVVAGIATLALAAAWYWGRDLSLWSVDSVRVTGKSRDDLQSVMALVRGKQDELSLDVMFENFRV